MKPRSNCSTLDSESCTSATVCKDAALDDPCDAPERCYGSTAPKCFSSRGDYNDSRYTLNVAGLPTHGNYNEPIYANWLTGGKTTGFVTNLDSVLAGHQVSRSLRPSYKSLDDPMCDPTYTLMTDARTWDDAEKACKAAGKQLATVRSAAQSALLLTAAAGNSVWIGGTDAASEGTWVWSPSNTPLSYTNWYSGQPDNHLGGEDCLEFNWDGGGKWNDASCTETRQYVCERRCTSCAAGKYSTSIGATHSGSCINCAGCHAGKPRGG